MDDTQAGLLSILLTALFVGLKLAGWVSWSWIFVFAPIWVPGVLSLGIEASVAALMGVGLYLLISGGHLSGIGVQDMGDVLEALPGWDALEPFWENLKDRIGDFFQQAPD